MEYLCNLSHHIPANRILIKSNGCKMSVDVTPPENPATKCSYRKVENSVVLRVVPFVFIAAILFRLFTGGGQMLRLTLAFTLL